MRGDAGVGPNDAYLAAMAEVLDDAVLTANVDNFEALDVPLETYRVLSTTGGAR